MTPDLCGHQFIDACGIQATPGLPKFSKLELSLITSRFTGQLYDEVWQRPTHITAVQPGSREPGISHIPFMSALWNLEILDRVNYILAHPHPLNPQRGNRRNQHPMAEDCISLGLDIPQHFSPMDDEKSYVIENIRQLIG